MTGPTPEELADFVVRKAAREIVARFLPTASSKRQALAGDYDSGALMQVAMEAIRHGRLAAIAAHDSSPASVTESLQAETRSVSNTEPHLPTSPGERSSDGEGRATEALEFVAPALIVLRDMCRAAGLEAGRAKADEMIAAVRGALLAREQVGDGGYLYLGKAGAAIARCRDEAEAAPTPLDLTSPALQGEEKPDDR